MKMRPTAQAFHARFGDSADCIGTEAECSRPADSAALTYCASCPCLVVRYNASTGEAHPLGAKVAPHPEGGDAESRLVNLSMEYLLRASNPYLKPGSKPFAALSNGVLLYPAYCPLRPGERFRREMGYWSGQIGQWVGVTLDGRLFRQRQLWGGDKPHPDRWEAFRLGYCS